MSDTPIILWSDGPGGWKSTSPMFNIFPLPFVPPIAPSSLTLPDQPTSDYFSFVQSTPSATWTITHNLGRNPSVSVYDPDSKPILGTVTYLSLDQVVVAFPAPCEGFAYLSGVLDPAIAAAQ